MGWGGICSVWLGLIVAQSRARHKGLLLEISHDEVDHDEVDHDEVEEVAPLSQQYSGGKTPNAGQQNNTPSVCVVIAARNESAGLATCVRTVLQQDYPALSVMVIDDRSEDDTYTIAQELSRADSRVRVERIDHLPPKWMGKSHALWRGTRNVSADWLLFTDVDCRLKPQAVARAIEEARSHNVKLLTLWPGMAGGGFWEHLAIPLCSGIIALWFGSFRVNDPDSKLAFANGQFLLIQRDAYERIHGHKAVRSAIIEDVPLAEHAKKNRVPCRVASGRDLVSVRMYDNYEAILNGWARIYVGALRSGTKIALSIIWLLLGSLLPYVVALVLIAWASYAWPRQPTDAKISTEFVSFAAMCANHLIVMMIASYRFWGMGRCRRIDLIWYPLSVCVVVRILARSWWWLTISRSIPWRDTRYAIDRRGRIVE